jgi:hypothetical protein
MSETWRVKTYYRPRVLIDTARVIDSDLGDELVCLTGPQLEMLRNLVSYLHRRSTFVSEYRENSYLAPTNAEWDAIQTEVAELEYTLMGCPEIVTQLQAIAAAVQCLCNKQSVVPTMSPIVTPMVEDYIEDGGLQYENPYPSETVIDDDRCAVAQLAWQQSWEMLTEYIQPTQDKTVDILLPAVMVVLAIWIGTPALGIPVGILLALLWNVIEVWVEGQLMNVANALFAAREDLVCAVYEGLAFDFRTAEENAAEVIDALPGFSPIDKLVMRSFYAPWAFKLCAVGWENQTDWAVINVTPGYCLVCPDNPGIVSFDVTWPPCEGPMFQDSGFCAPNGRLCAFELAGLGRLQHEFILGNPTIHGACTQIDATIDWYSQEETGTQGWFRIYRYDPVGEDWDQVLNQQLVIDSEDPMTIPTVSIFFDDSPGLTAGDLVRLEIFHTDIQAPTYPTDVMLGRFQALFTMSEL